MEGSPLFLCLDNKVKYYISKVNMRKKTSIFSKGEALSITHLDIPLLVIMGAVVGFVISGVFSSIMDPFIEAGENELFSFRGLLAGLSNIGLGIGAHTIGWLYWRFIFCKHGSIAPRWNGFGLLLGIMSLLSALILGANLCCYIVYEH